MRDLREILEVAKEDAPPARYTVDDIVAAGRRRRRWVFAQRLGAVGVLVVVVAATMLVSGEFVPSDRAPGLGVAASPTTAPPPPATATPSPRFTFTFGGYAVDDYRVLAPDEVNPAYQVAGIVRDGTDDQGKPRVEYVGSLTVYQPGVFKPDVFRAGTAVTVQGRDAYQAQRPTQLATAWTVDRQPIDPQTVELNALGWQYAPDAWAVIESEPYLGDQRPFAFADQVKVAERFATAPGEPAMAKVPFRVGYLPAGFTLLSVSGQSLTSEHRGMVTFVYAAPDPSLDSLTARLALDHIKAVPSVVISILWVDAPPPDAPRRKSRCNAGQHWCSTVLPGGEFYVAVEDPSKTLSDDELLRISDNLAFASIKEPATWYPAA
jgi:hypothetical protein